MSDKNERVQKIWISVIGGHSPDTAALENAFRVGELIAENDAVIVTGGLGGVMESASRGAKYRGGLVVGILPSDKREDANPSVDIVIPTGLGIARNLLVVRSGDVVIAIDGAWGTLSEIALAKNIGKPVISLGSFENDGIITANSPDDAVELAINMVRENEK